MERVELSLQMQAKQENTTTHILSFATLVVKITTFSSASLFKFQGRLRGGKFGISDDVRCGVVVAFCRTSRH